jgi:hypothetical protein
MITEKEIFEIASKHLCYVEDGWPGNEWSGDPEQLLKFAEAIYDMGKSDGYDDGRYDGYSAGYDAAFCEHGGY